MTPLSAWEDVSAYIPRHLTLWEAFYGDGTSGHHLTELGFGRYTSEYPPATICEPLKLNSPFQCTRNVEVPATTRLSLSVAAAQAVFAVAGIILVALLRKLRTPPKSTESLSGDDDIRSVVRKLRITVDKLDSKVDQLGTGHGEHEELIQKLLSK